MLLETSELSSALDDDDRALQAQSDAQFALAQIYIIDSQESLSAAADEMNAIQMIKRKLEKRQAEITKPINDALTSVRALFKPSIDRCEEAKGLLSGRIVSYREQVRVEREEAERRARAEWAARQAEMRAEAAQAAEAGEILRADELVETAAVMPVPEVAIPEAKATGMNVRVTWTAEVTDRDALLRAVLAGTVPSDAVQVNQSMLNNSARAMKAEMHWPGMRVVRTETVGPRGK
ncbi:MAG: hypothetical protein KGL39_53460 [Patescibacteria group bacterium]|nr:hypothetical protein [Patescibacteria group bacterium]